MGNTALQEQHGVEHDTISYQQQDVTCTVGTGVDAACAS